MRPSLAEIATLKRADEQCAAVDRAEFHRWQRDPWDVRTARKPARRVVGKCRECDRRGSHRGLCHLHYMRKRRGSIE